MLPKELKVHITTIRHYNAERLRELDNEGVTIIPTYRGKPLAAIVGWKTYLKMLQAYEKAEKY